MTALLALGILTLQDEPIPPNVAVRSLQYDNNGELTLKYEVFPGTNGFGEDEHADFEFFFTKGTNSISGGKPLISEGRVDSDLTPGIHTVTVNQGVLPSRFDRVVAVFDRSRSLTQRIYTDDSKAVLAKFAPGFTRRWAGEGIALYAKGSGKTAVYATVVELRRATARIITNSATSNVKFEPWQWWYSLSSTLPAGRPLRVMINPGPFEPQSDLWWMPLVNLGYTHGLKSQLSKQSFMPALPKPWTSAVAWNTQYAKLVSGPLQVQQAIANPAFSYVVGGIADTSPVKPTMYTSRNWLWPVFVDAAIPLGGGEIGADALLALSSQSQTVAGMGGLPSTPLGVQLDAGASSTLIGPGVAYTNIPLLYWRYLPGAIGFYSK